MNIIITGVFPATVSNRKKCFFFFYYPGETPFKKIVKKVWYFPYSDLLLAFHWAMKILLPEHFWLYFGFMKTTLTYSYHVPTCRYKPFL